MSQTRDNRRPATRPELSTSVRAKSPRTAQRRSASSLGLRALAIVPPALLFYVLLVLPFMGSDGKPRIENILFWPTLAGLVLAIAIYNYTRLDWGFFSSPPMASLLTYMAFAGASVTWAFSPENSFSRYVLQLLAIIIVLVPYAVGISTERMMQRLHFCCVMGVALNAYFVLVTPGTPIGHTGYFIHKQELGMFCGAAVILSIHELMFRGWRRWLAVASICLTVWVIFESQSKGSLAFLLLASLFSLTALVLCRLLRTSPAYIIGAIVVGFFVLDRFWSDPIGRIAWYLYGDSTITGRTFIWEYINYIVSQRSWFGWGFHSYWGVPNSPHEQAPGFVKDMVSTHSGYLELRLDTGAIGYWLFMVFIYASLHYIGPIARKDAVRGWLFIALSSYVLLLNFIESIWVNNVPLWILYLVLVGECVLFSRSQNAAAATNRQAAPVQRKAGLLHRQTPANKSRSIDTR